MADPLGDPLDPQKIVKNLQNLSKVSDPPSQPAKPGKNRGKVDSSGYTPAQEKALTGSSSTVSPPGSYIYEQPQNMKSGQVPTDAYGNPVEYSAYGVAMSAGTPYPADASHAHTAAEASLTPTPAATTAKTQQAPDDVLTAGLGMFFSQYLAPMMQQINQQNTGRINQWGNTMNQLLQQPLPAGVKAIMQPWVAQNAQTLGMMNMAAADQVAGQIPFNTLMNQLGSESSALETAASALPTAAANQMLGGAGGAQGVGQMLANQGLANTPIGSAVLSLLSQPSFLQSLTGQGNTGKGSSTSQAQQNPQQSITPIQVLPTQTTPAATTTQQQTPNDLANTIYAQQLAQAMLTANQPSAQQANTLAGAGYNP